MLGGKKKKTNPIKVKTAMQGAAGVSNRSHIRTGPRVESAAGALLAVGSVGRKSGLGLGRAAPRFAPEVGENSDISSSRLFFLMLQTLLQRKTEKGQLGEENKNHHR